MNIKHDWLHVRRFPVFDMHVDIGSWHEACIDIVDMQHPTDIFDKPLIDIDIIM